MKQWIIYIVCTLIVVAVLAVELTRIPTSGYLQLSGWNMANASLPDINGNVIWDLTNNSRNVYKPVWNQTNPCFVACNTYAENPAPDDAVLAIADELASSNPQPLCWECHGGLSIWGFTTYTGVAHNNGAPMTYGE